MIQNVLTHIGGIGGYGVVSLCLFFAVFLGVILWITRLKRNYLDSMRTLPLDDDTITAPNDRFTPDSGTRHE